MNARKFCLVEWVWKNFFFSGHPFRSTQRPLDRQIPLPAFQAAFFGRSAWARPYVRGYAGAAWVAAPRTTDSHLYIYRHRPDVNGVVHTHSPYATAFAAVGKPIPVYLTAQADEFGGPIPCGGFALIGGEAIGRIVVESIGDSMAVLLKQHGVFTIGPTAEAAVKAAVMVEDVARTVWYALQIGQPEEIPEEDVAKLHYRYTHIYGQ